VAPLRRLGVAGALRAIAIGPTGDVFVARSSRQGRPAPAVLHFAAGAARSDRTLCGRRTGLTNPVALAVDDAERLVVVNGFGGIVAVYAPGAAGDVAPMRAFTPACGDARSVALSAGVLAVGGSSVCIYDSDADASARPRAVFGHSAGLPLRCADGLGFDCTMPPHLRVADFEADAVHLVGPAAASRLHGPATGLDGPIALCMGPAREPG
jgi:hypothetical protein